MSILNIYFHDKTKKNFLKVSLNIRFPELLGEFPRDSKTSLNDPQ